MMTIGTNVFLRPCLCRSTFSLSCITVHPAEIFTECPVVALYQRIRDPSEVRGTVLRSKKHLHILYKLMLRGELTSHGHHSAHGRILVYRSSLCHGGNVFRPHPASEALRALNGMVLVSITANTPSYNAPYSEVLDPLTSYSALKPVPRSDARPEACLTTGCFCYGICDNWTVLHKGAQLDVVIRAREEHDGVALELPLFFRRRPARGHLDSGMNEYVDGDLRTRCGACSSAVCHR